MAEGANGKLVVDRERLTHKQFNRLMVLGYKMQNAIKEGLSTDEVEQIIKETDEVLASVVVSIPADWLTGAIQFGDPGWLDELRESQVKTIMDAVQVEPGKKTD